MTTILKLVQGATTTDLNDQPAVSLMHYTPMVAEGDEVKETVELLITGANAAAIIAARTAIVARLVNAMQRNGRRGHVKNPSLDRTFINYQPSGYTDLQRSEVLEGDIVHEEDVHDNSWSIRKVEMTIIWTRRNYWEGPEAQVSLSNANATDNTTGLTVYNTNDEVGAVPNKRVNYVTITSSKITGELPAACRLEMTNTFATSRLLDIFIGHSITNAASQTTLLEAEDTPEVSGSNVVSANASGGAYRAVTLASGSENTMMTWTLTTAMVSYAAGRPFKGLLLFFGEPTTEDAKETRYRLRIKWNATVVWEGPQMQINPNRVTRLQDVGTFTLPPWLPGLSSLSAFDLELTGYQTSGGNYTINIDALHLVPLDGWSWITHRGYGSAQNKRIVDDGIDGNLYQDNGSGADKIGIPIRPRGEPITLYPGKTQKIHFLQTSITDVAAEITRTMSIKLYYRPRRLTL